MSTIEVKPAALEQCAEAIGTTGDSLSTVYLNPVYDYIDGMAIEDTGSVVFSNVYDYNSQVMSRLRTDTVHISSLLVSSGSALSSSADAYRAMDEAARERYDGQYRAGGSVALDPQVPTGATPAAPASALAPPEAPRRRLRPDRQDHLVDRLDLHLQWRAEAGRALRTAPDGPADGGDLRRLRLRRSRRWRPRGSRISWRAFVSWTRRRERRSSSAAVRRCPPTPCSTPFRGSD